MVQTLEIPYAEGYPPIKVVTHTDYEALAESHRRLLRQLSSLEWNEPDTAGDATCPVCGSWQSLGRHAKDCELDEALRMARELEEA